MRTEWKTFAWLVGFFIFATAFYAYMTRLAEPVGFVALLLTGVTLAVMMGYFMLMERTVGTRPEDDPAGEIADGAGELGFFPAHSIWPLWVALTLTLIALGPVFGWWISLMGLGMGIWSLSGWVYEFYKGDYSH